MPLPNDEKLIALSEEILKQFEAMFGSHPGFRPGHAKGILLKGTLTSTVANQVHEQKQIIFDPIPRPDGIEPSDDPLLELRAAVYLISGRRRRTAPEQ